jgi:glyoxylase-like metal-dependent hydrolase (beta-lactamase superfamily II)
MQRLDILPVGPLGTNCILVWDPENLTGMVVDPGDEAIRIQRRVEALGFRVERILHTHGHFDHVGATRELQDLWACPALLHPADAYLMENLDMQTSMFGMAKVRTPSLQSLHEAEAFLGFRVLHVPGHSPGSCAFFGETEQGPVLLSGDTLFEGGVGRTDVLGGNAEVLKTSILKLFELPDPTRVIPGHGPETTIGAEARSNPFVRR